MTGTLFFARDPGPANHVAAAYGLVSGSLPMPVEQDATTFVADLRPHMDRLLVTGRGPALDVFTRASIEARCIDDMASPGDDWNSQVAACRALLTEAAIGAVVTGTSDIDDNTDRALWAAARDLGLRTHAFLDRSINLGVRFRAPDGSSAYPDFVYAPDENYRSPLLTAGVPSDRLRIAGPLYAAQVLGRRSAALSRRAALRVIWGANEDDRVVLFASECAVEMAALGRPSDYDEMAALRELTERLAEGDFGPLGYGEPARCVLVVRPHPRDHAEKYDEALPALAVSRVIVSNEGSPEEAILAADLVAGMRSTMIDEAVMLERPVLALVDAGSDGL